MIYFQLAPAPSGLSLALGLSPQGLCHIQYRNCGKIFVQMLGSRQEAAIVGRLLTVAVTVYFRFFFNREGEMNPRDLIIMATFMGQVCRAARHGFIELASGRQAFTFTDNRGERSCDPVGFDRACFRKAEIEGGVKNGVVFCHPDTSIEFFSLFPSERAAGEALRNSLKARTGILGRGSVPVEFVTYLDPIWDALLEMVERMEADLDTEMRNARKVVDRLRSSKEPFGVLRYRTDHEMVEMNVII